VEEFIPDSGNYGTVTQCPVMGEKVIVDKNTKALKYNGKIYYLCCPSCVGQFKQNPEKYAK
jgi:YHS domain-containing protein